MKPGGVLPRPAPLDPPDAIHQDVGIATGQGELDQGVDGQEMIGLKADASQAEINGGSKDDDRLPGVAIDRYIANLKRIAPDNP